MEIFQLKQFITIAQSSTMREAAESLHLSQPALSQNLKKLEAELGCRLFDRSHNQLRITPFGEVLLERAHRIMFDLQEVRDEIEALKAREASTIRIGFFSKPTCVFLAPQIAAAFPDLRIRASVVQGGDGVSGLLNGDLDILVLPEGKCPKGLESVCLFEERAALSIPIDCPMDLGEEVRLEDLAGLRILVPQGMGGLSGWYESLLKAAGAAAGDVERIDEKDYLAVMDDTDRVHLTTSLMSAFMGEGVGRAVVPLAGPRAARPISMAWRAGDEKVAAVASLARAGGIRCTGGHAFLPHILYPGRATNLEMAYE